ncbi:hypothetical protein HHK36_000017 [Tetracentron sinense]|uniref:NAC domain-containing protein n=1 Tax=Tetracentron sinense TaxID=13715 RepID=A0A834ZQD1_TETSI|nr:hypothetical protein HHK36_000017 [Tetracentron sinense]
MSLSVNGQSRVPPGFRFHPTEEELLHYYLRKKVAYEKIDLDVIQDVDLNKLEPWDIQDKCRIGSSTPQNDWYFFSHKDKKYPTGTRTNRATAAGFWKATGRDKVIYNSFSRIGMRKTLVFYTGRAPHGHKSDWIMHEYRLDDDNNTASHLMEEDGWVVCRVFKKKTLHSSSSITTTATVMRTQMLNSCNDGGLDQILECMGRTTCKQEKERSDTITANYEKFMQAPRLESTLTLQSSCYQANNDVQVITVTDTEASVTNQRSGKSTNPVYKTEPGIKDWGALDRLVASQLISGQAETSNQIACFSDPNMPFCCCSPDQQDLQLPGRHSFGSSCHPFQDYYNDEMDLWS